VCGELIGNKMHKNCLYMPAIHSRAQTAWIDSFYRQNGYLGEAYAYRVVKIDW